MIPNPTVFPQRIAITGAAGYVGRRLTELAAQAGIEVVTFARNALGDSPVPLDRRMMLMLPDAPPPGALEGVDAVVHLAVADPGQPEAVCRAINVTATVRLREVARQAGVGRFVFVSSQSAHAGALNVYGRTKYEAEVALGDDNDTVVVRPGLIWDGSDDGLIGQVGAAASKLGFVPVIGGSATRAQTVFLDDVCRALIALAAEARPPKLVELADPAPHLLGDLIAEHAALLHGRNVHKLPVPLGLARPGAAVLRAAGIGGLAESVRGIIGYRAMDTAPQLEALGWELRPWHAGVGAVPPVGHAAVSEAGPELVSPRRVAIIGGGKMGSMRASMLTQRSDAEVVGAADPSRVARLQISGAAGRKVRTAPSINELLAEVAADRVIVSASPEAHVSIIEELDRYPGDLFVERPLTPRATTSTDVVAARPERALAVGYQFAAAPHVTGAARALRDGELGTPTDFFGLNVRPKVPPGTDLPDRWEWDVDTGGVIPHLGGHLVSILATLASEPLIVTEAVTQGAPGAADLRACITLDSSGLGHGLLVLAGDTTLPRGEMLIQVRTSTGRLTIGAAHATFVDHSGATRQFDGGVPDDPTPLDGGGGLWVEVDTFLAGKAAVDGATAVRIETVLDAARAFAVRQPLAAPPPFSPALGATGTDLLVGADGGPTDGVDARGAVAALFEPPESGPIIVRAAEARWMPTDVGPLMVAVPDGPSVFAAIGLGGPLAAVRHLGVTPLARAGLGVRPAPFLASPLGEALAALVAADAARVAEHEVGSVFVDGYAVDRLATTGDLAGLRRLIERTTKIFGGVPCGLELRGTHLLGRVLDAVADLVDFIVLPAEGPGRVEAWLLERCDELGLSIRWTDGSLPIEFGPLCRSQVRASDAVTAHWADRPGTLAAVVGQSVATFDQTSAAPSGSHPVPALPWTGAGDP